MKVRHLIVASALSVTLAGCSTSTGSHVTLGPSPSLDEVEAATTELFEQFNRSWPRPRDGVTFILSHNHPDLRFDRGDFDCWVASGSRQVSLELHPGSLRPEPDFLVADIGSEIDGQHPAGEVFRVSATMRFDEAGHTFLRATEPRVVLLDGRLYLIIPPACESS